MKFYAAWKWVQGIFFAGLFLICFLLLRTEHRLSAGLSFLLSSGMLSGLLFSVLDLLSWKFQQKKAQELSRLSDTDDLTQLPNASALKKELVRLSGSILADDISCAVISFDNIHSLNRTYGHDAGDETLREFGNILRISASDLCFLGRKSGKTFIAIFRGNSHAKTALFLKRLRRGVAVHNAAAGLLPIHYHAQTAYNDELHYASIYDLIKIPSAQGGHSA